MRTSRQIPPVANVQCGVFSAGQAHQEGWTPSALRHAVQSGRLVRLRAAAFQVADLGALDRFTRERWLHAAPAIAAALTTPGAMASHSSAAVLHGVPLAFLPDHACVSVVPWHTGEIRGLHVHRVTSEDLGPPYGRTLCTTVARTVIDLAREHGPHAGVVPLDFALRQGLTTPESLTATLRHCRRWPGVRAARTAIDAADPRSESPLESLSRLRIIAAGLPDPELQTTIADQARQSIGRVDFYWEQFGVVGEADGLLKI